MTLSALVLEPFMMTVGRVTVGCRKMDVEVSSISTPNTLLYRFGITFLFTSSVNETGRTRRNQRCPVGDSAPYRGTGADPRTGFG